MRRLKQSAAVLLLLLSFTAAIDPRTANGSSTNGSSSSTTPLTQEALGSALERLFAVLSDPYSLKGAISIPTDRLTLAGVAPSAAEGLGFRGALRTAAAGAANSTAPLDADALRAAGEDLVAGLAARAQAASAAVTQAVDAAQERFPLPPGSGFSELGKAIVGWLSNTRAAAAANATRMAATASTTAAGEPSLTAAGRRLMSGEEEEAAEALASIKDSLATITTSTRRALLQAGKQAVGDGAPLTPTQRALLQLQPPGAGGPDPSGTIGLNSWARAYLVIFSNIFDFFADTNGDGEPDGLFFLLDLINAGYGTLEYYNWIRDLANALDAPFDNLINTNYFPLPQNNDEAEALLQHFLGDYCSQEEAEASSLVLGAFTGPELTITLDPTACPVLRDPNTGRQFVDFAECSAAELSIETTPLIIDEPYISAATYTGAQCAYSEVFGIDTDTTFGGGEQEFTFRRSSRGVDIVPVINQFNAVARFRAIPAGPGPTPAPLDFGLSEDSGEGATVGLLSPEEVDDAGLGK